MYVGHPGQVTSAGSRHDENPKKRRISGLGARLLVKTGVSDIARGHSERTLKFNAARTVPIISVGAFFTFDFYYHCYFIGARDSLDLGGEYC